MYHYFVRRRLRSVVAHLNAADFAWIIRQFDRRAEHWFAGDHALSGRRTTPDSIAAWYRRLAAVFPGIRFTVVAMTVAGPPWNTLAAVEWTDEVPDPTGGGPALPNGGVFVVRLRWGKAMSFHVHCDTARLEKNLAVVGARGIGEARAVPIRD